MGILSNVKNAFLVLIGKQLISNTSSVQEEPKKEIDTSVEFRKECGKQICEHVVPVPEQTTMLQELQVPEVTPKESDNTPKSRQKSQKKGKYKCRRYTKPQIKSALEMLALGMHPCIIGECLDIHNHSVSNFYRDTVKVTHPDLIRDIEMAARAVANNVTYPETKAGQDRVVKAAIRIMARNGALDKDRVSKALVVSKRFITLNSADYERPETEDLTKDPNYEDVSE